MDSSSRALKGFKEGRKVRVIAKIKSLPGQEIDGGSTASWISVNKPDGDASESVTISFGDQPVSRKETYEVDYCYEQNEDTENIFTREVKSLIPGIFDGHHATVIAYGARGTGKTSTIQGTIEKPGLASLTINELLLMAKEKGKSVSISYYEVYMDYVYDLLDPKRATVLVLDNGQGKIQLKGLSRIPVKSLSDFHGLYFVGSSSHKQGQKNTNEPPPRSHRGLIVHISSTNETASDTRFVSKMNFVDMAGSYEDARRRSTDGTSLVENSKINKSIYALLNVASALNSNDNHVPYRESKLTRILQDSLGGAQSRILMISCLNSSFCQDSIYMANLAARSCQVTKRVASSAIRKMKSSTNSVVHSSLKNQIPKSVSATAKKQTISRFSFSEKKASVSTTSSAMKGRKLFDDATSYLGKLDKETKLSSASSRRERLKNGGPISVVDQVKPLSCSIKLEEESTSALEKANLIFPHLRQFCISQELSVAETSNSVETIIMPEGVSNSNQEPERIDNDMNVLSANGGGQNINEEKNYSMINIDDIPAESTPEVTSSTSLFAVQSSCLDKENSSYMINEESSPPISARLQALSNSLRLLCSSTPTCKIPVSDDPCGLVSTDAVTEQQTLKMERSLQVYDEEADANPTTPWERLSKRSTGLQVRFDKVMIKINLFNSQGIGEKRATAIIELREESPEPFKSLDDLMEIGLSAKQIKGLMKKEAGELLFK
ncbi:kinesin-like protein KIF22-B isoform X1 [Cucumis melo var. makuwa]|uniref:Kinesin-like protein KIF22-B isoform X1 n=1 Tax=Cucumis melo var. makuwa TaxID=1194695 RepID=A0A5A7TQI9_CUCMM|nr:kinesin-like protein KIF22-B isoform X1 [Cucumis melo var. makuwa]